MRGIPDALQCRLRSGCLPLTFTCVKRSAITALVATETANTTRSKTERVMIGFDSHTLTTDWLAKHLVESTVASRKTQREH